MKGDDTYDENLTADADTATVEVNEAAAAFLDAVVDLVKPILAPVSLRIIIAYLRGQIGHGVVELEAYDELGVRIGGDGRKEYIAPNERGQLCVFYHGHDLCLTVGGSLVLVTYDNDGTDDAWIAEARVLPSLEVVAMFGADAVSKMVAEIANVVEGHDGGRSTTIAGASGRARGLRALADLAKMGGKDTEPGELRAFALLTAMLARNIPAETGSASSPDVDDVFTACNLVVPMMACTLDASHREPCRSGLRSGRGVHDGHLRQRAIGRGVQCRPESVETSAATGILTWGSTTDQPVTREAPMITTESTTHPQKRTFDWDGLSAEPADDANYVEAHDEDRFVTVALLPHPVDEADYGDLIYDAIDSFADGRPWSYGGELHLELFIKGEQVDGSHFSFDDDDDDDNDDEDDDVVVEDVVNVVNVCEGEPRQPEDAGTTPEVAAADLLRVVPTWLR